MQVGDAFNKTRAYNELKLIASDPDEDHAFKVTNYSALDGLLSKLQQSIISVEGEAPGPWPPCGSALGNSAGGPRPALQPRSCPPSMWHAGNSCHFSEPQLFHL